VKHGVEVRIEALHVR